jgi:hypothetical protein
MSGWGPANCDAGGGYCLWLLWSIWTAVRAVAGIRKLLVPSVVKILTSLDLLHTGLVGRKMRLLWSHVRSCLTVFAMEHSSVTGTRRGSCVPAVVTLSGRLPSHAVLGELSSLSVLPSYDGSLWQPLDHNRHHHPHHHRGCAPGIFLS